MKNMTKTILAVAALLVGISSAVAQDLLVKCDGTSIKVRVVKVTKKKIEYVRFKTMEPLYTMPIKDIAYIEYPNGDMDVFDRKAADKYRGQQPAADAPAIGSQLIYNDGETPRWHGPALVSPQPDKPSLTPPDASRQCYEPGDIYDRDGVRGIVVLVTDGGLHGAVMSLDETCLKWCSLPRKQQEHTGASDKTDGRVNQARIAGYVEANNLSWEDFPAFKWCRDKGEGWYLPAVNELWALGTLYNGGSRIYIDRKARRSLKEKIGVAGGKVLHNTMLYHSSTEALDDGRYSVYTHMGVDKPYIADGNKTDELFVRAFYRF